MCVHVCACISVRVSEAMCPAQPKRKGKSKYINNKNYSEVRITRSLHVKN